MKADFTRNTFRPLKHFTRVLMQQGRVQLDADWNEQTAILLRYLQVLAADLIGPRGGPSDNCGFAISALTTPPVSNDFRIGQGHYYVDGILCEADTIITYMTQPDYPAPTDGKLASGAYQVYLDVWERQISYVEDDGIREVALGGPDTAARTKVVWQVKVTPGEVCPTVQDLNDRFQPANRGRLKAMTKQDTPSTDPCIVPSDARYRGAENQLYRVEIHRGGKTSATTFKWSRENGSVIFPIVSGGGTNTLTLDNLGRDDRFGLREGDWVEVQDDDYVLQNRAGNLLQIQSIDRTSMAVTLSGTPDPNVGKDLAKHPLLRRWDHKKGDPTKGGLQLADDGAALIVEDGKNWLTLEDGVQIQFQPSGDNNQPNNYRTGDYWLIPARTATGDVEWPTTPVGQGKPIPIAVGPYGVEHHYAPLAVITLDASGTISIPAGGDCRFKFDALAKPMTSS
jgi:hypothetical protein